MHTRTNTHTHTHTGTHTHRHTHTHTHTRTRTRARAHTHTHKHVAPTYVLRFFCYLPTVQCVPLWSSILGQMTEKRVKNAITWQLLPDLKKVRGDRLSRLWSKKHFACLFALLTTSQQQRIPPTLVSLQRIIRASCFVVTPRSSSSSKSQHGTTV